MTRTRKTADDITRACSRAAIALFACALLACTLLACGDGGAGGEAPFQLVFHDLEPALMSVSGTAADDVWVAGADVRDGSGAMVLHFDGDRWTRMPAGVERDLWWVFALAEDSVWFGGAHGTVLHYDGSELTQMDTPGSETVYGLWGAAEDDVWAVGGDPDQSPGFVWHFDGDAWSDMSDQLPDGKSDTPPLFKIWGRDSDDIWMVGMDGTALHWDGSEMTRSDTGTDQRLFTVHGLADGSPSEVAVGGFDHAVLLERSGTKWHDVTPDPAPAMLFGVFMQDADRGYAVGYEGSVLRRKDGAWKLLDIGYELFNPFHAVWVDPEGGVWAVGGDVQSPIPAEGMLLHQGSEIPDVIED